MVVDHACDHRNDVLDDLFPHLSGLLIHGVTREGGKVRFDARARAASACPRCGTASVHVHSGYQRTLADLSIGGGPVEIRLHVRRFFCGVSPCPAKTFAEQVPGLTMRRVRRTLLLRESLTHIALALAGRAGVRLAALLGIPASRNTLLRLVNAVPDPEVGTISTLGVDDFAFRRFILS